jgi:hypothetical protein
MKKAKTSLFKAGLLLGFNCQAGGPLARSESSDFVCAAVRTSLKTRQFLCIGLQLAAKLLL